MIEGRCKKNVSTDGWHRHQCRNKVVKDGYCMIHHPDSENRRAEKSEKLEEEKRQKHPLFLAMKKVQELSIENKILKERIEQLESQLKLSKENEND